MHNQNAEDFLNHIDSESIVSVYISPGLLDISEYIEDFDVYLAEKRNELEKEFNEVTYDVDALYQRYLKTMIQKLELKTNKKKRGFKK